MCIEDNPLTRALPYFIIAVGFLAMTLLFSTHAVLKKWKPKKKLYVRIVFGIITFILFLLGIIVYTTRYKCL